MTLINYFLKQLNEESETTRKMLQIVPNDKYDWAPHPKSMNIQTLATHIAELPTWITLALTTEELDFAANDYAQKNVSDTEALLALFEQSVIDGRSKLVPENESLLNETWTMRNGNQVYIKCSKEDLIRITLSQIIHHRAQLGVYLRLLNIPIPGSYGPSADEQFEVIEVLEE
ncbi:DinB family protein [Inquilinus sp. KBS0705]|nr:DinB family protein [Inquilinus sp. KBS0705]